MTPAQRRIYWRLWSAARRRAFQRMPGGAWRRVSPDPLAVEVERLAQARAAAAVRAVSDTDLRHAAHQLALGRAASSQALSNRDLDRVWALFRLLADPLDLTARLEWEHPERGERRRQLHVARTAMPAPYAREVLRDKFGRSQLEVLRDDQLRQAALTLRLRRRRLEAARRAADAAAAAPAPAPEPAPAPAPTP
jgi:hypothetical protein